jgi:hypothetical protein
MEDQKAMAAKKDQHTVGSPEKPRGQQMGFAGNPDQNRQEMKDTPAISGRRPRANKLSGDPSLGHVSSDPVTPSSNTPSTVANVKPGRAGGGATQFKRRLAKKRAG